MRSEKKNIWLVVYVVVLIAGLLALGGVLFPQGMGLLTALVSCVAAGVAGYGIYLVVQNRSAAVKIVFLALEVMAVIGLAVFFGWRNSDERLLEKQWKTYEWGSVSFEYPYPFKEVTLKGKSDASMASMRAFTDNNTERAAMYFIYDFVGNKPAMEDSLKASLSNTLNSIKASDVTYFDTESTDYSFSTKVGYTIKNKSYVGYACVFNQGNHFESLFFIPRSKSYSDAFLERIVSGISFDGGER